MNDPQQKPDWCPTQHGTMPAYEPQYLHGAEWRAIQLDLAPGGRGVPAPLLGGGVMSTLGLCGYAQAQALAWSFAAIHAEQGRDVLVRVQQYELVYDLKARKVEG